MIEFEYLIKNPVGLHMKPAKELVELVKGMDSNVFIIYKDKRIKVDSILRVVTAGITTGQVINIEVVGGNYKENSETIKNEIVKFL